MMNSKPKKERFVPEHCKECLAECPENCECCIYAYCKKPVDEKLVFRKWNNITHTNNDYEEFHHWFKQYFMIERNK